MYRISDRLAPRIEAAIGGLDILQVARDEIGWEVTPALVPRGREMSLAYMVAISVPVPGPGGDYVLYMHPLHDPHAPQAAIDQLVRELYAQAQAEADQSRASKAAQGNGHRESPGGLIMP